MEVKKIEEIQPNIADGNHIGEVKVQLKTAQSNVIYEEINPLENTKPIESGSNHVSRMDDYNSSYNLSLPSILQSESIPKHTCTQSIL